MQELEIEKYLDENGQETEAPESVIWQPQPKQALMMGRAEDEALYGGAAGGGKTDYLVIEALRQVQIPWYKGIIFRRTFPELNEIIDKADHYYPRAYPRAKYNSTRHCWTFPSGAKIYFGAMQYEKDKYKYQGQAYDFIGFDELTHFTASQYIYLQSRNRPNGPDTQVYMRATANPGGVGHGWVKDRFVTAGKPCETRIEVVKISAPEGVEYRARSMVYIPATVFDNRRLLENNPNYITTLAALPEAERNALLYGDWDSFTGQVFKEFRNNPDGYDSQQWSHVIHPFRIPDDWKIWRSYDFGYAKPFSVGWYAVDHEGCIYRIKEYYGCTGNPNTGLCLDPVQQARNIREIEKSDPVLSRFKISGVADPAIWDASRGESIAEMMEAQRIYFEPGDHERIPGKMQCHYRLAFDKNGRSMFYVFDACKEFIRTVPALVYDQKHVEDIDTEQEDHIYDEWRYLMMRHPINPRRNVLERPPAFDPLNLYHDEFGNVKTFRV